MNYPVFDLHCDTALAMLDKELRHTKSLKSNDGHIDLERAARLAMPSALPVSPPPGRNCPGA